MNSEAKVCPANFLLAKPSPHIELYIKVLPGCKISTGLWLALFDILPNPCSECSAPRAPRAQGLPHLHTHGAPLPHRTHPTGPARRTERIQKTRRTPDRIIQLPPTPSFIVAPVRQILKLGAAVPVPTGCAHPGLGAVQS